MMAVTDEAGSYPPWREEDRQGGKSSMPRGPDESASRLDRHKGPKNGDWLTALSGPRIFGQSVSRPGACPRFFAHSAQT